MGRTTFPVADKAGAQQDIVGYVDGSGYVTPATVIEDSAQAEVLGKTSDAAYAGSGNAGLVALLKGLYELLLQISDTKVGTMAYTTYAVTGSSTVGLAGNASRVYLRITNDSDTVVYVKTGASVAVVNEGMRLEANGGVLEFSRAQGALLTAAFNVIHGGTGTKNITFAEGT